MDEFQASSTNSPRKSGLNLGISVLETPRRRSPAPNFSKVTKKSSTPRKEGSGSSSEESSSINSNGDNHLSDKLRVLATTEMEILEIKEQIKALLEKKRQKEHRVNKLKIEIERSLYKQVHDQVNNVDKISSNPPPVVTRSPSSSQRPHKLDVEVGVHKDPLRTKTPNEGSKSVDNEQKDASNSWLSKPLSYLQQFDTLIQHEFEKLNLMDELSASNPHTTNELNKTQNSMSSQLWTFMNEVKSNLMLNVDEDSTDTQSNIPESWGKSQETQQTDYKDVELHPMEKDSGFTTLDSLGKPLDS
ncbi:BA75_00315T0 [Komagataella pastoris]|uniref:BA75_00315T0 n=1 Tax=Komagataella pastoris TaxID=4922 RepID=A0A1B2J8C8_PICPA|nr:BA75_00315T0 [Komagataella pastoris]